MRPSDRPRRGSKFVTSWSPRSVLRGRESRGRPRRRHFEAVLSRLLNKTRLGSGATILDVGCGTGYHLSALRSYTRRRSGLSGVEPHLELVRWARLRCRRLPTVSVEQGSAQRLPIPDASVDVTHARWSYFFGPGCEPGLRELSRVMRTGGSAFVIDNDATRSTFGRW